VKVSTTLLRMYREVIADSRLVEMVVKEGRLSQHIVVAIVARSPMGFPRPT
jgi:hypothetical protein